MNPVTTLPASKDIQPNAIGTSPVNDRGRSVVEDINQLKSEPLGKGYILKALSNDADPAIAKATVERELFLQMAQRDPAMAALYITRKREEIASTQQIEAVVELAEHTEQLEWIDHIVQMLNSGEYPLPKEDGTKDSPDRTIAVGDMDSLAEVEKLLNDKKLDGEKSTGKDFFTAVNEYLSAVLAGPVEGSVHDMIMQATGTDYDPSVMKFDQFQNMLQARRSAMSQDGTRLSTEHQYARANIDQIKLQMSGMIDQMYGMMSKLASFN